MLRTLHKQIAPRIPSLVRVVPVDFQDAEPQPRVVPAAVPMRRGVAVVCGQEAVVEPCPGLHTIAHVLQAVPQSDKTQTRVAGLGGVRGGG